MKKLKTTIITLILLSSFLVILPPTVSSDIRTKPLVNIPPPPPPPPPGPPVKIPPPDIPHPFPPKPSGNYYALIVGISDYAYINDLSYCDEDATDWYIYLSGIGYDHITVLGDGHPSDYPQYDGLATKANILAELEILTLNKGSEDIIAFIFSGHGAAFDKTQHVICPYDTSATVWDYDIFDYEIAPIIGNTNAGNVFLFLDSCSSGGFIPELQSNNPVGTIYVTTTCTAKGYGYDEPSYENGAWTYWFLDAGLLQGGSGLTDMEGNFDWAYSYYPIKGKNDRPQEWDEDGINLFYLI